MNLKICPLVQGWTLLKVHSHQNSIDTITYYNPKVFETARNGTLEIPQRKPVRTHLGHMPKI